MSRKAPRNPLTITMAAMTATRSLFPKGDYRTGQFIDVKITDATPMFCGVRLSGCPKMIIPAVLCGIILISAIIHITAELSADRRRIYVFKPLTTILITALLLYTGDLSDFYTRLLFYGLLFSLAGDVFLMLPRDRFIPGLISFLIAHICYSIAFLSGVTPSLSRLAWLPYLLLAILLLPACILPWDQ